MISFKVKAPNIFTTTWNIKKIKKHCRQVTFLSVLVFQMRLTQLAYKTWIFVLRFFFFLIPRFLSLIPYFSKTVCWQQDFFFIYSLFPLDRYKAESGIMRYAFPILLVLYFFLYVYSRIILTIVLRRNKNISYISTRRKTWQKE